MRRIEALDAWRRDQGWRARRRAAQAARAFRAEIERRLIAAFDAAPEGRAAEARLAAEVAEGAREPEAAAAAAVAAFLAREEK